MQAAGATCRALPVRARVYLCVCICPGVCLSVYACVRVHVFVTTGTRTLTVRIKFIKATGFFIDDRASSDSSADKDHNSMVVQYCQLALKCTS